MRDLWRGPPLAELGRPPDGHFTDCECQPEGTGPTLTWPDFGLTTLHNDARRREPVRTILAGQPPSAQVTTAGGTVYGSVGWGSSPSERSHEFPGPRPDASPFAPLPVRVGMILAAGLVGSGVETIGVAIHLI